MGLFDRQILTVLTEGKSKEFRQILREAGFSHNTSKPRVLVVAKMAKNVFILILRSKDNARTCSENNKTYISMLDDRGEQCLNLRRMWV
jgi:hypothetical protein